MIVYLSIWLEFDQLTVIDIQLFILVLFGQVDKKKIINSSIFIKNRQLKRLKEVKRQKLRSFNKKMCFG